MWLDSGGSVEGRDVERVGAGGSRRTVTEEPEVWALQKEISLTFILNKKGSQCWVLNRIVP